MAPGEKVCYGCGEKAPKRNYGPSEPSRWSAFLDVVFMVSVVLSAASLVFSEYTPPFTACLAGTVVLLFLKWASDQFTHVKQ
jgi:hypothetical protein